MKNIFATLTELVAIAALALPLVSSPAGASPSVTFTPWVTTSDYSLGMYDLAVDAQGAVFSASQGANALQKYDGAGDTAIDLISSSFALPTATGSSCYVATGYNSFTGLQVVGSRLYFSSNLCGIYWISTSLNAPITTADVHLVLDISVATINYPQVQTANIAVNPTTGNVYFDNWKSTSAVFEHVAGTSDTSYEQLDPSFTTHGANQMAFAKNGDLLVEEDSGDNYPSRLIEYSTTSGTNIGSVLYQGTTDDDYSNMAVDGRGNIYLADCMGVGHSGLFELPLGSSTLTTISTDANHLDCVYGMAIDQHGNMFVSNYGPSSNDLYELPLLASPTNSRIKLATLYFAMGSASLNDVAQSKLKYLAVHDAHGVSLEVDGYMQNNTASAKFVDISMKRAKAVESFLKSHGVTSSISVVDKKFPKTSSTIASARRVEVYLTSGQ